MTRRYKVPANRHQQSFLPESIEDYVSEQNPVRAIDAYVDSLDLATLGFHPLDGKAGPGQPAYDPACLLKLYLYGYTHKVRSSRDLEKETHRNVEVIWLMGKLQPSYKTIADFRKNNGKALKAANKDFIELCQALNLFGGEVVGIDGSFFNGNASNASIYTQEKLDKQLRELEKQIEAYHQQLAQQDQSDDEAGLGSLAEDPDLTDKLEQLRQKQAQKQALAEQLQASGQTQISTTDNDARLLRKRGQVCAGYNVQLAVDGKHKLIVDSEATNEGNDSQQLSMMASQAKGALGVDELSVVADAGYYESEQLRRCEDEQITAYVAIPAVRELGRFPRETFQFDKAQNVYICPDGERLEQLGKPRKMQNKIQLFYASKPAVCTRCPKKNACLAKGARKRTLYRWEHEEVLERHKERMKDSGQWMRLRSTLVEHPFGTLKRRAGWDHFLVRGLKKVAGELSLMTLGYNLSRVMNIMGIEKLKVYCEQRKAKKALVYCYS
jgi:transposase